MQIRSCLIALLLFIPCIAVLNVPFYNRIEPTWNGIPFFYWYQLAWTPLSALCLGAAYFMSQLGERS